MSLKSKTKRKNKKSFKNNCFEKSKNYCNLILGNFLHQYY